MNRKQRSSKENFQQNHLGRALDTFEEALELLDRHQPDNAPAENLPALPLPSLLDRCQAIVGKQKRAPKFLVCFPGVPQLDPAWWKGRVRSTVFRRLPEIAHEMDQFGKQAIIDAMQSDLERRGCDLVVLATPEEFPFVEKDQDNFHILTCHPWTSFVCGKPDTAQTLEEFCAVLQSFVAAFPKSQRVQLEELGKDAPAQAKKLTDVLNLQSVELSFDSDLTEFQICPSYGQEQIEAGPTYDALCTSLGYDKKPYFLPPAEQSAAYESSMTLPLSKKGTLSRISQFLSRLRILNEKERAARISMLVGKLDECLEGDDFTDRFDKVVSVLSDKNSALLMIMAGAHFSGSKQGRLQSLSMLTGALDLIPDSEYDLRTLVASVYLDLNEPALALDAMTHALRRGGMLSGAGEKVLNDTIKAHQKSGDNEHGHALLIDWLNTNPPRQIERKRVMIEIGTTRENVPGQGSTRKLGELCARQGIDFITVDMDPGNSQRARNMFRRLGLPFQAITSKGEDYLAQYEGPIDYVFLDAYDFDHGQHSEVRQIRYERHLGSRINDEACHQMHLDCAEALLTRLSNDGIICFDDTWISDTGEWAAKGTTAVPFLLNNGFKLVEARNRAALLSIKDSREP